MKQDWQVAEKEGRLWAAGRRCHAHRRHLQLQDRRARSRLSLPVMMSADGYEIAEVGCFVVVGRLLTRRLTEQRSSPSTPSMSTVKQVIARH